MSPLGLWRKQGPALRRLLVFQLLSNLGAGVFALLFNLYLLALGYREDVIGLAAGLNTLGAGLAALVAGRLVRRFGASRTLILALLLFSAASGVQALVSERLAIAILAVLIGVATAWLTVPVMPLLAAQTTPEARADASALTFAVQNLSITVGTLLGGILPAALAGLGLGTVGHDRVALLIGIAVGALGVLPLIGIGKHGGAGAPGGDQLLGQDRPRPAHRVQDHLAGVGAGQPDHRGRDRRPQGRGDVFELVGAVPHGAVGQPHAANGRLPADGEPDF
jgi:MFS family permease